MNEPPTHPERSIEFLKTELETGMTFATIAESADDTAKISRNLENARKACQSLHHFMDRLPLSGEERLEFQEKLKQLEQRLERLEDVK